MFVIIFSRNLLSPNFAVRYFNEDDSETIEQVGLKFPIAHCYFLLDFYLTGWCL